MYHSDCFLFVSLFLLVDCRLHICLYYREILVKEVTTSSPEGCRISHGQSYEVSSLDQVIFPYPEDNGQRKNIEKLLNHLERGVILWMAPDGLYAKRLCQSRIYWDGPLALCSDRPNKLERDQTCKLFDTQQFLAGNSHYGFDTLLEMSHGHCPHQLYGSALFIKVRIAPQYFWACAAKGYLSPE